MRNKVIAENDILLVCTMFNPSFLNQAHGIIMVRLLFCESIYLFALSTVNYCIILMSGLAFI